jgi:hypothetical protein
VRRAVRVQTPSECGERLDLFVAGDDLVIHFGDLARECAEPAILFVGQVDGVAGQIEDRLTSRNQVVTFFACLVLLTEQHLQFGRVTGQRFRLP